MDTPLHVGIGRGFPVFETVGDDGDHGSKIGETGPQSSPSTDVCRMELFGSAGPESFPRVAGRPDVQVTDLRALGRGDSDYAAGWCVPGIARARGDGMAGLEAARGARNAGVESWIGDEGRWCS